MEEETRQKKKLEEEVIVLRSQLLQVTYEADQVLLHTDNIYSIPVIFFGHVI